MTPALRRLSVVLGGVTALMLVILVQQLHAASQIQTKAQDIPLISPAAVDIPLTKEDKMLGNPGAPFTLVGFFDITNKESKKHFLTIYDLVSKNPTKVRFVWKHYPEKTFLYDSTIVHQGLYCAGKQNKFWQLAERLAQEKRIVRDAHLLTLAEEVKLNISLWQTCVTSEEAIYAVQNDSAIGQSLYLPHPPMLFINNKLINLEEDFELKELISSLIKE